MDRRRPNAGAPFPFLESASRNKAKMKMKEGQEVPTEVQRNFGTIPVITTSQSTSKSKPDPAKISKLIKAESGGENQTVNFGRAYGIRPLEEKERYQDRPNTPIVRKSVDQILGPSSRQSSSRELVMPKRRTINEILSRTGDVDQANFHISKVKKVKEPQVEPLNPLKKDGSNIKMTGGEKVVARPAEAFGFAPVEAVTSSKDLDEVQGAETTSAETPSWDTTRSEEIQPETADDARGINAQERIGQTATTRSKTVLFNFSKPPSVGLADSEQVRRRGLTNRAGALQDLAMHPVAMSANMTLLKLNEIGEDDRIATHNVHSQSAFSQTQLAETYEAEVQTDPIGLTRKWTQEPVQMATRDENKEVLSVERIRAQSVGVGSDPEDDATTIRSSQVESEDLTEEDASREEDDKLHRFLGPALKVILEALRTDGADKETMHYAFDTASLGEDSRITMVSCEGELVAVTSVNTAPGSTIGGRFNLVTIWEARTPGRSLHSLRVWGTVTQIQMNQLVGLVVAGTDNGALGIFNTRELDSFHPKEGDKRVRVPSIFTGMMQPNHPSAIQGLEILPETFFSAQIVSMDKSTIICWNCIHSPEVDKSSEAALHSSSWSTLRLRIIQIVDLAKECNQAALMGLSLKVWQEDELNYIVGSNAGYVLKGKFTPAEVRSTSYVHFLSSDKSNVSSVQTLDLNIPMGLYVAGATDRHCHLIDLERNKVLSKLSCDAVPMKVLWSRTRHSVLYVCLQDKIDVWDLLQSDLRPTTSLPFPRIVDFHIMNSAGREKLVIVAGGGTDLVVESLTQCNTSRLTLEDAAKFRTYLGILG